jgi:uncharacterized membrane protein YfcA
MQIYLPIAEMSVNWLVIIGLGALVGFLSGMFGVGGGFLTTPLLVFYGIPPAVAVASAANQITGASVSGALAHWRRGGVDLKMGSCLIAGSLFGTLLGSFLFRYLQSIGQLDLTINLFYIIFLGGVGLLMLKESITALWRKHHGRLTISLRRRHEGLFYKLPFRQRFHKSKLYISPLAPAMLGFFVGILTAIMGVGGGFLLVPAMIYLLGMPTTVVIGTSLFQIMFATAATTILHSLQTQTVDLVLAVLLLVGGVVGAQFGARAAQKLPAEQLRLGLAVLVLLVAVRLGFLITLPPSELFSIHEGV